MFSFYTQAHRKIKRIFALFHHNSCWETTLNLKHHKQFDRKFGLFKKEKKLFRFIVRARPMGNVQTKQCPQWVSLLQKNYLKCGGVFFQLGFCECLVSLGRGGSSLGGFLFLFFPTSCSFSLLPSFLFNNRYFNSQMKNKQRLLWHCTFF